MYNITTTTVAIYFLLLVTNEGGNILFTALSFLRYLTFCAGTSCQSRLIKLAQLT